MSDNKSNQLFNGLSDVLGTSVRSSSVRGFFDCYMTADSDLRRHLAVTTALELIKADVLGSSENKSADLLSDHMTSLASYADTIQDALETNKV